MIEGVVVILNFGWIIQEQNHHAPRINLYLRQQVKDYARWKESFDTHLATRRASGATDKISILRNVADRNDLTINLGWRNLKTARLFFNPLVSKCSYKTRAFLPRPRLDKRNYRWRCKIVEERSLIDHQIEILSFI